MTQDVSIVSLHAILARLEMNTVGEGEGILLETFLASPACSQGWGPCVVYVIFQFRLQVILLGSE